MPTHASLKTSVRLRGQTREAFPTEVRKKGKLLTSTTAVVLTVWFTQSGKRKKSEAQKCKGEGVTLPLCAVAVFFYHFTILSPHKVRHLKATNYHNERSKLSRGIKTNMFQKSCRERLHINTCSHMEDNRRKVPQQEYIRDDKISGHSNVNVVNATHGRLKNDEDAKFYTMCTLP